MEEDEINALLPDEMLRKVFSFLSPKDLKSSVLVCRRWQMLLGSRWFPNPSNDEKHLRNEMGAIAENLRFLNLVDDKSSVQSTEFEIVEKLVCYFPNWTILNCIAG